MFGSLCFPLLPRSPSPRRAPGLPCQRVQAKSTTRQCLPLSPNVPHREYLKRVSHRHRGEAAVTLYSPAHLRSFCAHPALFSVPASERTRRGLSLPPAQRCSRSSCGAQRGSCSSGHPSSSPRCPQRPLSPWNRSPNTDRTVASCDLSPRRTLEPLTPGRPQPCGVRGRQTLPGRSPDPLPLPERPVLRQRPAATTPPELPGKTRSARSRGRRPATRTRAGR